MTKMASFHQAKKRKAAAAIVITEILGEEDDNEASRTKRGKTRNWVRRRNEKGLFRNIVEELSIENTGGYKEMTRMSHEDFLSCLATLKETLHQNR